MKMLPALLCFWILDSDGVLCEADEADAALADDGSCDFATEPSHLQADPRVTSEEVASAGTGAEFLGRACRPTELLSWLKARDAHIDPRLYIGRSTVGPQELGLFLSASRDGTSTDSTAVNTVFRVPSSAAIGPLPTSILSTANSASPQIAALAAPALLAAALVKARAEGQASPLAAYVECLPTTCMLPFCFVGRKKHRQAQQRLAALEPSVVAGAEGMARVADELRMRIEWRAVGISKIPSIGTWRWAMAMVMSRASQTKSGLVLVPLWDLANHRPGAEVGEADEKGWSLSWRQESLQAGELCRDYGSTSNEELLSQHGFTHVNARHDWVQGPPIRLDLAKGRCGESACEEAASRLLRVADATRGSILQRGHSAALLARFRVAALVNAVASGDKSAREAMGKLAKSPPLLNEPLPSSLEDAALQLLQNMGADVARRVATWTSLKKDAEPQPESKDLEAALELHAAQLQGLSLAASSAVAMLQGRGAAWVRTQCAESTEFFLHPRAALQRSSLPRYTATGFKQGQLPTDVAARLRSFWTDAAHGAQDEATLRGGLPMCGAIGATIKGPCAAGNVVARSRTARSLASGTAGLPEANALTRGLHLASADPSLEEDVRRAVQELLAAWVPAAGTLLHEKTYGPREYREGAMVLPHVDHFRMHAFSAIINVAHSELKAPWPLVLWGHESRCAEVDMQKDGLDVLLLESATVMHSRPQPLQGDSYANVFVHFSTDVWSEAADALQARLVEGGIGD